MLIPILPKVETPSTSKSFRNFVFPNTSNVAFGSAVPIPTFWPFSRYKSGVPPVTLVKIISFAADILKSLPPFWTRSSDGEIPLLLSSINSLALAASGPDIWKGACGLAVPIPILPDPVIVVLPPKVEIPETLKCVLIETTGALMFIFPTCPVMKLLLLVCPISIRSFL